MNVTVQSAAPQTWVPLVLVTPEPLPPAPALTMTKTERHAAETRMHAVAPVGHYERVIDTMRLQAFRRDAAQTASLTSQTPSTTASASTSSAPAVKGAPVQVNPAATPAQVTELLRTPTREAPPVRAPTAVDAQSSTRR
jgi:hypothetical protein